MVERAVRCYLQTMKLLVLALVSILLFSLGCFYVAGVTIGGEVMVLVLLMGMIIFIGDRGREKTG
jgi:hypothetical protein